MDDQPSSSSSSTATNRDRRRLSGFFNNLIHRRDPPPAIQEESKTPAKVEEPVPAPNVPPPRLPPPTLQELGLSLSIVTQNLNPSHFTTPPSSGAFLSPNYLLLCHAQGLDVLPITSPPEPQPLPLIRRVSFKSIVVMEQRGVLVAIAGRRDGVRVYALEEIRKAVEWRVEVQIKREKEKQRREQAKRIAASPFIEARSSADTKYRKARSSTPPPGTEALAKVSIPRKASHSSITPTASATSFAPPVPLIPRTPTIKKLKPPKKSPAVPPAVSTVPEPTGLPPPYPGPSDYFAEAPQIQSRSTSSVTVRSRGASISEVLSVPPISRINTNVDGARQNGSDTKEHDWIESSDDEAINIVAAGASGSQALDERTSSVHPASSNQPTINPVSNTPHPIITSTTPPRSHRRSLSRRNRPANLDLSLSANHPANSSISPAEPSPAPTLLTLRQALAHPPGSDNAETAESGYADADDDDEDEGGAISLSQALMESRIPDLPPPGTTRPQQPIYISSSHSLVAGDEEPTSPRTSEAHSTRSETVAPSAPSNNRRRRWSLMLSSPLGVSNSSPALDRPSPTTESLSTPAARETRPNRLSRSRSHRSVTPPANANTRRPASANPATSGNRTNGGEAIPPLPSDNTTTMIPSSSRSRFIPRIISNAIHNIRSDDRPSTSSSGFDSDSTRKASGSALSAQTQAAKLEYVKLPGTKGSLMIKAVETAKKSFLAILCGENGEKVELFAGTYRTALGLSRTFILPDSPRSLELQLQGDDLVEVFLVFSQNVFGLEPATVRVREVRIGRAERRAARRRAREARAGTDAVNASGGNDLESQGDDETNVNVSIGVTVAVGSTVVATGTGHPPDPSTPALIPSEHPQQQQEDRSGSPEGLAEEAPTPAEGSVPNAVALAEELVALATAQMGPYTTFQQLTFAPRFPLASIADDYVIPPSYPDFLSYKKTYEHEATDEPPVASGSSSGSSSADATQVQFSPPGLPVPTPAAPCRWFYLDPKGVVHGPWKASLMQTWYKDSLLPADLPVRREHDTEFILLKDLRQQSVDTTHPFSLPTPAPPTSRPQESQTATQQPTDAPSTTTTPFNPTDKPLLKPISLLAQPRHFGPPALFYSSRGGHSTTIVDARGRSVLKDRFFWSEDEDSDTKASPLIGRMGDVKRLEAVDIKDRSVLIAMRQGGVEAVDLGDALLRPADDSRGVLPQFSPAPSTTNRRQPFVWRMGTPISMPSSTSNSVTSSTLSVPGKQSRSNYGSLPRSGKSAKSPNGKTEFNLGDAEQEFHDEVLFLGRKEDEIYICERNAGSFRILRLCPTN